MVHQADALHDAEAATEMPDHESGHPDSLQCCETLGLCAAVALAVGTDDAVVARAQYRQTLQPVLALAGLYEPGLDVPPPRIS